MSSQDPKWAEWDRLSSASQYPGGKSFPPPVIIRGGKTMRLLSDCRARWSSTKTARAPWQHAAKLIIAAAEGGSLGDAVLQFERILIHQGKLVFNDATDDWRQKARRVEGGPHQKYHRLRQPPESERPRAPAHCFWEFVE